MAYKIGRRFLNRKVFKGKAATNDSIYESFENTPFKILKKNLTLYYI